MIRQVIAAMIRDCRSRDLSEHTIQYYQFQCEIFAKFCDTQEITDIEKITADTLRQYLIHLKESGHNEGGVHAKYRAMKTLMLWYEKEFEPEGWKNPVHKIRPPKVPEVVVKPVTAEQLYALLAGCDDTLSGHRDYALILFLLDTGMRISECWALEILDLEMYAGTAFIKRGKGGRSRTARFGKKTTKALTIYDPQLVIRRILFCHCLMDRSCKTLGGRSGKWVFVSYQDKDGWVHEDYLTKCK